MFCYDHNPSISSRFYFQQVATGIDFCFQAWRCPPLPLLIPFLLYTFPRPSPITSWQSGEHCNLPPVGSRAANAFCIFFTSLAGSSTTGVWSENDVALNGRKSMPLYSCICVSVWGCFWCTPRGRHAKIYGWARSMAHVTSFSTQGNK